MQYGCIGEHLKHSFSKEIHNALADYQYDIVEIEKEKLCDFATKRDFIAINVTIPYKEEIIPFLYEIDEHAEKIGAVNTVVNKNGKLFGYNTDFFGMSSLITHAGIEIKGKKVVILGTGGTSKTSFAVAKALGAKEVLRVSRDGRENAITYDELYQKHSDAQVIINTTPVGMFPNIFDVPVKLSCFNNLLGVIDAVYNPIRTSLILEAKKLGIPAEGGLYMLVAQAVRASEYFIDKKYPDSALETVFNKILKDKENIVLTGMPASGKSTVGKIISELTSRPLIDTDTLIEEKANMPITEIFKIMGEEKFRQLETEVICETASKNGVIISTGGGAILRDVNVSALSRNGRIYFIDRPVEKLIPTSDRPLSSTVQDLRKRFSERYPIYKKTADVVINADCEANEVAKKILGDFNK